MPNKMCKMNCYTNIKMSVINANQTKVMYLNSSSSEGFISTIPPISTKQKKA
jgi:hypothetical protein